MMGSNIVRKILVQHVLPVIRSIIIHMIIYTIIYIIIFYFQRGIPLAYDLKDDADILSVEITQGDETVLLTDPEEIQKAALFARTLYYRFGKAEGGPADVMCIFTFKDGTKMELGANSTTVFKNGKQYRGDPDSCWFFITCTQWIFFRSHTAERGP